MEFDNSKSNRILEIYQLFLQGKIVDKQTLANRYCVNVRSIQRDIDSIRSFLEEQATQNGFFQYIEYDKKEKGYRLVTKEATHLTEGEMLAICKILIESRAFSKDDMISLLNRILNLSLLPKAKEQVESLVANELFHYLDPSHPSINTQYLWDIATAIKEQRILEITYCRMNKKDVVSRKISPVGILFSEYYFYLMGVIGDSETRKDFEKKDDIFPTIYRIDRIKELRVQEEHFYVPYSERFQEGDYKNRIQFMYGGSLETIEFEYYGPSIESIQDKLPTAIVSRKENGEYVVKAEVFGSGILMWLLSQGSNVRVLSPKHIHDSWFQEALGIVQREDDSNGSAR